MFEIDVDNVWNAFFTYSLCLDYHERKETMELPHSAPSQADRLRALLESRNGWLTKLLIQTNLALQN
jgi:hypothetical protein